MARLVLLVLFVLPFLFLSLSSNNFLDWLGDFARQPSVPVLLAWLFARSVFAIAALDIVGRLRWIVEVGDVALKARVQNVHLGHVVIAAFALGPRPDVVVLVIVSVVFVPGIRVFVEAAVVLCVEHKCVEVIHLADHVRMFLVILPFLGNEVLKDAKEFDENPRLCKAFLCRGCSCGSCCSRSCGGSRSS